MRYMRMGLLVVMLGLGAVVFRDRSASAEGFLDKLYEKWFKPPVEYAGPRPEDTLISPFGSGKAEAVLPDGSRMQKSQSEDAAHKDLAMPHQTDSVLAEWLARTVTDIFNVDPAHYEEHLASIKPYMTEHALSQYKVFMENGGMLQYFRQKGLTMAAAVNQEPWLESPYSKGVQNGVYKWRFNIRMVISALEKDRAGDPMGKSKIREDLSKNMEAVAQITRVAEGGGENGVVIEILELPQIDGRE